MTLLENTYQLLREAGLVENAEAFSSTYLSKNRNWFSYQKHTGRDFSFDAAIQCLRSLRQRQAAPGLDVAQRMALNLAERDLLRHLNEAHLVADVC